MFKEILDSHKNGILVLNKNFQICYVNKVLKELFLCYDSNQYAKFLDYFNLEKDRKELSRNNGEEFCNLKQNISKIIKENLDYLSVENISCEAIVNGKKRRIVLSLDIRKITYDNDLFIVIEFYRIKTQDQIVIFNKRFLDDILDILDESVFYKDENLKYIYANKYYCDFVNMRKFELLGRKDSEIFSYEEAIKREMTDKKALKMGKYSEDILENGKVYRIKKERIKTENGVVIACLIKDITYEKKEMEKAYIDDLTEINNRRAFDREIKDIFLKKIGDYSLVLVDVDFLRDINNNYGHSIGDEYLKATAYILKKKFGNKNVYRMGGDEFSIITSLGEECLKKCSEVLEEAKNIKIRDVKFSLSMGVGKIEFLETPLENFNRIDKALYESKTNGKGRITKV